MCYYFIISLKFSALNSTFIIVLFKSFGQIGFSYNNKFAYAWDFVSVELAFRGFLIIGMIKILGKGAVLPMAVTYAFYHFGKPAGETISSVFGGYILGIIALLYKKHIRMNYHSRGYCLAYGFFRVSPKKSTGNLERMNIL